MTKDGFVFERAYWFGGEMSSLHLKMLMLMMIMIKEYFEDWFRK